METKLEAEQADGTTISNGFLNLPSAAAPSGVFYIQIQELSSLFLPQSHLFFGPFAIEILSGLPAPHYNVKSRSKLR
jgi:hypothetical protein